MVIKYILDLGGCVPGLRVVHNGRYEDVGDVGDRVVVLASAKLGRRSQLVMREAISKMPVAESWRSMQ